MTRRSQKSTDTWKVLILSNPDDTHVARLVTELDRLDQSWVLFDPGTFPRQTQLCASLEGARKSIMLTLADGTALHLEEIGSVWYRRPTPIQADEQFPELERTFIEREARAGLWGVLRSIDGLWLNHPDAIREAAYKPRQLHLAQTLGLAIPQTLITNSPEAFLRFYEQCQGKVIYKLLGFPSYQVEEGMTVSTYTRLVPTSMLSEANRIRATAHLFQAYQEKICDVRVVIIGQYLFAVEIHPQSEQASIDFRSDYGALSYGVHRLPASIQQALLTMTRLYRLHYAAIDLVYTQDHQYSFLELNPVGQLGWLEAPTGLPLFERLAQVLARRRGKARK
jgi:hypothetical protein